MELSLKLGEWAVVGRGWFKKRRVMFAGESSPGVFSLVLEWTDTHNSAASNLYFHENQREFAVFDGRAVILGVSNHEVRLRFEK